MAPRLRSLMGFGSAAKALRVNAAVNKTITGFFHGMVLVQTIMFSKLDGFDKPFFRQKLNEAIVCVFEKWLISWRET